MGRRRYVRYHALKGPKRIKSWSRDNELVDGFEAVCGEEETTDHSMSDNPGVVDCLKCRAKLAQKRIDGSGLKVELVKRPEDAKGWRSSYTVNIDGEPRGIVRLDFGWGKGWSLYGIDGYALSVQVPTGEYYPSGREKPGPYYEGIRNMWNATKEDVVASALVMHGHGKLPSWDEVMADREAAKARVRKWKEEQAAEEAAAKAERDRLVANLLAMAERFANFADEQDIADLRDAAARIKGG